MGRRVHTGVELSKVVCNRLLINGQAAKLHDVAAHVVGEVVAGAPLHQIVLLLQGLLCQVRPVTAAITAHCLASDPSHIL